MNDNVTEPVPALPQNPGSGRAPGERAEAPTAPHHATAPLPTSPQPSVASMQQRPVPAPPTPAAPSPYAAAPSPAAPSQVAPPAPAAPSPAAPYAGAPNLAAPGGPHGQPRAPYGYPQVQDPYGGGRPGARQPGGAAPDAQHAPGAAFGLEPPARKKRIWPAVVSTAAVTALLVGGGSAALTTALLGDSTPQSTSSGIGRLGQTSPVSVDSVTPAAWESVAASVAPTVVAIDVVSTSGEGQGSGVIYDTDGHIITNNHVVAGAQNDTVTVTLSDGRLYDAKIVGLDASTDLAVVKIVDPPADLTAATFADSEAVVVGNAVMAVGNPLGLANTVTTGIVSAVARPVTTAAEGDAQSAVVTNAIQIDAAVNPGNSGGPLFDAQGRVIGITSSIATLSSGASQSGSIGLGFAIPSNQAKSVGDQLIASGVAEHAFLGVTLSDSTATADGVTRRGALVHDITPDSPAAKAGIQSDDVVVAIDGEAVTGYEFLTAAVRERVAGEKGTLTLVRGGTSMDVTVTFAARQTSEEQPSSETPGSVPGSKPTAPEDMTPDQLWEWFQQNGR